jgi:Cu(I)/Ag(I) efflux system membrane protein CusA/SilA
MWSTSVGAEVMKPLAAPVLGGMVSSLIHVLVVTPVIFFWIHERRLGLTPEAVSHVSEVPSRSRRRAAAAAIAGVAVVAAFIAWRMVWPGQDAPAALRATVIQTVHAKDLDIALLSETGALRQGRNRFFIEFRRTGTTAPLDVGTARASANMPMPGMVMSSGLRLQPTDVPGRYAATAEFGMSGMWHMSVEWDGPAGRGTANFEGGVQ